MCADADFGTEPELSAIGESGAGVHVAAGGIDLTEETLGGGGIFCYDGLGVFEAVFVDVLQCVVERIDGHDGKLHGEELAPVVVGLDRKEEPLGVSTLEGGERAGVGMDLDALIGHWRTEGRKIGEARGVDDQAIEGVAYADAAGLGVTDDARTLVEVGSDVEIGVDDTCSSLDDRDFGVVADRGYEAL